MKNRKCIRAAALFLFALLLAFSLCGVFASNAEFSDVPPSHWSYDAVAYVFENGLMVGMSEAEFAPNASLTREMFVNVLYRIAKLRGDATDFSPADLFSDVAPNGGAWYTSGVLWAAQNGITAGMGDGTFGIGQPLTREQMARLCCSYLQAFLKLDLSAAETGTVFADADEISAWAKDSVSVFAGLGILIGDGSGKFLPKQNTTRAQAAVIFQKLMLFLEEREKPQECSHEKTQIDAAQTPSCTESGKTEGEHCLLCGKVLTAQQILPPLGHDTESFAPKEPTCTESGYTAYTVCRRCGLSTREELSALGHSFGAWQIVSDTLQQRVCARCGDIETRTLTPPAQTPAIYFPANDEMYLRDAVPVSRYDGLQGKSARNEGEGMQLILRFVQDAENVRLSLSALTDGQGHVLNEIELYRQHYVEHSVKYNPAAYGGAASLPRGFYPDALIPITASEKEYADTSRCNIAAGENGGFWITVWVPKDQPAGLYTGTLTVTYDENGRVEIPVCFEVWDITLPDAPSIKTAFALWDVAGFYADRRVLTTAQKQYEMEKTYYDFLQKYRISATDIPVRGEDSGSVERWFSAILDTAKNARCSAFRIPYYSASQTPSEFDTKLRALLIENGLLEKAFYYRVDEKYTLESLTTEEKNFLAGTAKVNPEVPNIVTTHADALLSLTNGICPLWHRVDESWIRTQQAAGKTVWWYGCAIPTYPSATYQLVDVLLSPRIVHWMEKDVGVSGELYWATTLWTRNWGDKAKYTRDPWTDPYTAFANGVGENAGDGMLLYPGYYRSGGGKVYADGHVNRNVPVPTLRLEAIRDGFEDYEYLTLLEQRLKRIRKTLGLSESTDALLNTYYNALYLQGQGEMLTGNFDHADPVLLQSVRESMASDLMRKDENSFVAVERLSKTELRLTVYTKDPRVITIAGESVAQENLGSCYAARKVIEGQAGEKQTVTVLAGEEEYTRVLNFSLS